MGGWCCPGGALSSCRCCCPLELFWSPMAAAIVGCDCGLGGRLRSSLEEWRGTMHCCCGILCSAGDAEDVRDRIAESFVASLMCCATSTGRLSVALRSRTSSERKGIPDMDLVIRCLLRGGPITRVLSHSGRVCGSYVAAAVVRLCGRVNRYERTRIQEVREVVRYSRPRLCFDVFAMSVMAASMFAWPRWSE